MKKLGIFATAALMLASVGVSTSASAQRYGNDRQYERRDDRGRGYDHRRYDGDRRFYNHRGDRRWQRNHGWRNDRRCWTEWRHHRQIRVCR